MMVDPAVVKWRRLGRLSGFPVCCVRFFCHEWRAYSRDERQTYFDEMEARGYPGGYVPCPAHLRAVEIVTQISHVCRHYVTGCGYTVRVGKK